MVQPEGGGLVAQLDDFATLHSALDRILAGLTRLGAPVANQLRPGLPAEEIAARLRELPFVPPRELLALYQWRDGTAGLDFFFPSHDFLSLEDAIEDYYARRDVALEYASPELPVDELWHPRWFPIFRASWGTEYTMLCPERETTDTAPILDVDVEGDSHDMAYTSLTHMVRVLADCYETGAFTMHSDGYLEEDEAKVGDIRRGYAPDRAEAALEALRQRVTGEALNQGVHDVIELHDVRAVEPLLALLRDGDDAVRRAVILPLGLLGDERAITPLLELVANGRTISDFDRVSPFAYARHILDPRARRESYARMSAIDALESIVARTGRSLPLEPFLAAMRDPEPMVRMRAAVRLGASGGPRALAPLVAALTDHDSSARLAAIQALGRLGDLRALEPLRRLARSSGEPVRQAAAQAIARIESTQTR